MSDSRKLIEVGWQAALSCHARHGVSGWSSHREDYIEYTIAAAEKAEPVAAMLAEKDALLRQALEALEPFELSTSLAERTAEAIRNHLGVKND